MSDTKKYFITRNSPDYASYDDALNAAKRKAKQFNYDEYFVYAVDSKVITPVPSYEVVKL